MPGGGSKIQLNSVLLLPVLILGPICLIKTWVIKKMEKYFKMGSPNVRTDPYNLFIYCQKRCTLLFHFIVEIKE